MSVAFVVRKKKAVRKQQTKTRGQPGRGGSGSKWQGRDQHVTLHFNPKRSYHLPLPLEFFTKFTASGSFYTGFGAGTGDYNWSFALNTLNTPFSAVTSGVTWNGISVSTFQCPGVTSLFSATMYADFVVYDATLELDIVPQSVADSVVATLTPSLVGGQPSSIGAALSRPFTKQQSFAAGRVYHPNGDYPFIQRMSVSKLQGLKRENILNDTSGNYVGTFSGGSFHNPPSNYPWVLNVETGDNSNLVSALEIRIRITYFTKCFGLQSQSLQDPKPPKRSKTASRQAMCAWTVEHDAILRESTRCDLAESGVLPHSDDIPETKEDAHLPSRPAGCRPKHPVASKAALKNTSSQKHQPHLSLGTKMTVLSLSDNDEVSD